MAAEHFTDRKIQGFKPKARPYLKSEVNPEGNTLYLRVYPSGRKTFLAVTTINGKRRWLTLGIYPGLTLTDARDKCRAAFADAVNGIDPLEEKRKVKEAEAAAPTVEQFADTYMERWAMPNKKESSAKEDRRLLDKEIIPVIGQRKVKDVTKAEVIALLDNLADRAPITANRCFALLRKMFNFAIKRALIPDNQPSPCDRLDPPGGKERAKDRYLTEGEISTFWQQADELMNEQTARALKLILVTGQRPGEICAMHWAHVAGRWWTIPAELTKNGQAHRVFLSDLAVRLMGAERPGEFVFPARQRKKEGQPIHRNALAKAVRINCEAMGLQKFTPHDLRRTAATQISRLGHSLVVPKILNHVDSSVTAIYDRYSFDDEKQKALESWSRKLEALAGQRTADNVVPLRSNERGQS